MLTITYFIPGRKCGGSVRIKFTQAIIYQYLNVDCLLLYTRKLHDSSLCFQLLSLGGDYLSINDTAETSLTYFSGGLPYYSRSAEHIYTSHFLTLSPMSSNTKGCWSCRARRKRCDGKTPRCNTCDRLGIDCAGFETIRPSWMDGGAEQRAYCGWLKNAVKSARRQQIHTRRKSNSDSSSDLSQAKQSQQWLASPKSAGEVVVPRTAPYQVQTLWTDAGPSSSSPKADQRTEYWLTNSLNWETDTELLSHGVDEGNLGSLDYTISEGDLTR